MKNALRAVIRKLRALSPFNPLVRYALRRVKRGSIMDMVLGKDVAQMRRLMKTGQLVMGKHSIGEPQIHTFPHDNTRLVVGDYCSLGGIFLLGGQHGVRSVTTYIHRTYLGMEGAGELDFPESKGDLVIGSDVWVGFGAWVMSGLTLGHGSVVGTGAVVTKDVPPYAIVGGSPAKIIGWRNTEEQREALLEIKWWDWSDDEVQAAVPYLESEDIDAFIAYARDKQKRGEVQRSSSL